VVLTVFHCVECSATRQAEAYRTFVESLR